MRAPPERGSRTVRLDFESIRCAFEQRNIENEVGTGAMLAGFTVIWFKSQDQLLSNS